MCDWVSGPERRAAAEPEDKVEVSVCVCARAEMGS